MDKPTGLLLHVFNKYQVTIWMWNVKQHVSYRQSGTLKHQCRQTAEESLSFCCRIDMWKDHCSTSPPPPPPPHLLSILPPSNPLSPLSLPVGWLRTPPEWHLQITQPIVLGPLTREPLLSTRRDLPAFCHIITANPLKVAPHPPILLAPHTQSAPLNMQRDACRCVEQSCGAEC